MHLKHMDKKLKIIYFCYLNRVEHENSSEMCLWIVRFGQKLRSWDYFKRKGRILEKVPI
jgi:hypothetical protein